MSTIQSERFEVYYDSLTEAIWFSELHPVFAFENNDYIRIASRGNNKTIIEKITSYDKPDIIVLKNNIPVLTIEKTQEVPTGHNVGQRFARLVRSIELGIPTFFYFPFDARKHGDYTSICNLNARLLKACELIYDIHQTPLLCINWPTDAHGEIITDGTEDNGIKRVLAGYVESGLNKLCQSFADQLKLMKKEYSNRLYQYPAYGSLPPSVHSWSTRDVLSRFAISDAPDSIHQRSTTYVYEISMTPEKCKRQDPYTGTCFIYDYLVCRNGPNVADKKCNLAFYFPKLTRDVWIRKNPNDVTTKSCNWYLTANLLLFKDGAIMVRG